MSTLRASRDVNWTALLESAQRRGMVVLSSKDPRLKGGVLKASAIIDRISEKFISSMVSGVWQVRSQTAGCGS
jgi:hypothetical protein